ncbi:hypothetical protein M8C13_08965 [Crossiella sp. SN42]|uniref:BTAD domain-containing putative transcriptional regulator n=1 Tax=Crossiella sp. SN42 TaxID=2944808 RepID=UPI00207D3679|nr:BTAD domain-containing putative transcriptional regulator [Crossiella sp. SN42]MCO1575887.1 hypothetical protein [Crossiella sp. SN42]
MLALIVGLPWALVRYVGWPLPDQLPTRVELIMLINNPLTASRILDVLACATWLAWGLFLLELGRSALTMLRLGSGRARGPLARVAAGVVGSLIMTYLTHRATQAAGAVPIMVVGGKTASSTAHELKRAAASLVGAQPGAHSPLDTRLVPPPRGMEVVTETVRIPEHGIYDSLWRVAERVWGRGQGHRWPELFALNQGILQADGRALQHPNQIRPGWHLIAHRPAPSTRPAAPPAAEPPPDRPAPATPQHTSPPQPTLRAPPAPGEHTDQRHEASSGFDLPGGAFLGLGLATAITTTLATLALRRRRRYRIGSADRSDLRPPAPIVRALHHAQDHRSPHTSPLEPRTDEAPSSELEVGVRDGRPRLLDLAATHGLGLIGPGAAGAARALLLALITRTPVAQRPGIHLIAPEEDLARILESTALSGLPAAVTLVPDLDIALNAIEAELLTRAHHHLDHPNDRPTPTTMVLLAAPVPGREQRLQAVLDNGKSLGITGLLLGQWPAGTTIRIRADGTIGAASPGLGTNLLDTRLFTLPATDTTDLLDLLTMATPPSPTAPPPAVAVETGRGLHRPAGGRGAACVDRPDEPLPPRPRAETAQSADHALTGHGPEPSPRSTPLALGVLGPVRLTLTRESTVSDLTRSLTRKHHEFLLYLALHPDGARREAINEALWPDSRPPRPFNSFHTTVSRLRRVLTSATELADEVIEHATGRYRLNHELITVDHHELHAALLHARTAADPATAVRRAVSLYTGPLAEDLTALWIAPHRERIRRDLLDALGAFVHDCNPLHPREVLAMLEKMREIDVYNESIYRDIMRSQAELGQREAVARTLDLLDRTLRQIDEKPQTETLALAETLLVEPGRSGPTRIPWKAASAAAGERHTRISDKP